MKRKLLKLLSVSMFVPALLAACGGEDENKGDYEIPATVGFLNGSFVSLPTSVGELGPITVLKSGEADAQINIAGSDETIQAYNESRGTGYTSVPANLFSITQSSLSFTGTENSKSIELTWNAEGIAALEAGKEYAIALQLTAANDAVIISDVKGYIVIHLAAAVVEFSEAPWVGIPITTGNTTLTVLKGGETAVKVNLATSEEALEAYNEANGTNYIHVPAESCGISAESIEFGLSESSKQINVTWDGMNLLGNDYAIAVQLTADDDVTTVSAAKGYVIIHLTSDAVPEIAFETTVLAEVSPAASRETVAVSNTIGLSFPVRDADITISYKIDNSLIAAYNAAHSKNYLAAPDGLVAMAAGSSVITAGSFSTTITCNINSAMLFEGNVLKAVDNNNYLVPVRVTSISREGLELEDDVMYIPIVMKKIVKGPWTILEGQNLCYAKQEGTPAPDWALGYVTDRLFDGNLSTEWISWWDGGVNIPFPQVFVVDMENAHVFTKFLVQDHGTAQGNYRDYEIYVADEYDGENTQWSLAAKGMRGYDWVTGGQTYDFPPAGGTINYIAGRYLKFVILKAEFAYEGAYPIGNGKLMEVYGEGF